MLNSLASLLDDIRRFMFNTTRDSRLACTKPGLHNPLAGGAPGKPDRQLYGVVVMRPAVEDDALQMRNHVDLRRRAAEERVGS